MIAPSEPVTQGWHISGNSITLSRAATFQEAIEFCTAVPTAGTLVWFSTAQYCYCYSAANLTNSPRTTQNGHQSLFDWGDSGPFCAHGTVQLDVFKEGDDSCLSCISSRFPFFPLRWVSIMYKAKRARHRAVLN